MKIFHSILLLLGFLLLLNSCSSESQATTDKTFAYFNLRYLQPDNEVKAEAHFSKGLELDAAVPIKLEQDIIFQGEKMKGKEVSKGGTRYNIAQKENFQNEYTFEFSPLGAKRIEQKLTMNSLEELTIQGGFSKSKGVQISWKGKPLSKNEKLVFLFNNEKNNFASAEIDGPTNTSTINIAPEKLKKLPDGSGEIYLVRKESNTIEHPNVTILSETEFYSPVISVTILP